MSHRVAKCWLKNRYNYNVLYGRWCEQAERKGKRFATRVREIRRRFAPSPPPIPIRTTTRPRITIRICSDRAAPTRTLIRTMTTRPIRTIRTWTMPTITTPSAAATTKTRGVVRPRRMTTLKVISLVIVCLSVSVLIDI